MSINKHRYKRTIKLRTWIFAASYLAAIVVTMDACKGDMKFDKEKWNEQKDPANLQDR